MLKLAVADIVGPMRNLVLAALTCLVVACSSAPVTTSTVPVDGGSDSSGDSGTSPVAWPKAFGSYVVLGDSISDKGAGAATGPFYRDLLYQNDDVMYPAWKGLTLKEQFGVTQYLPKAVGGAVTGNLQTQLGTVPASLPTPILVTVTIGGNDLHAALGDIIVNPPAAQKDAQRMADNIDAFLQSISDKYPGQVYVLEADIYDPSGDNGDFSGCPGLIKIDAKLDHSTFTTWNGLLKAAIDKPPPTLMAPLHDTFLGHDVHAADDWFYTDCIHPTPKGQHQIRRMLWKMLTGQDGPQ